jgi:hypothetical protein
VHLDVLVVCVTGSLQVYHEALLCNLLECVLFHSSAVEALGDASVDLIDFVARRLGYLVARGLRLQKRERQKRRKARAASAAAEGVEEVEEDEEEETTTSVDEPTSQTLRRRQRAVRLRVGVTSVVLLRYLAEHATFLPLSAVVRLVETHDLILALVPLIENPPWIRKARSAAKEDVGWEKLIDFQWQRVPPSDLLKLTQPEAQIWLALHFLLSHEEIRSRWPMHSYRKSTLMRLRRFLNPILLDQIPPLADLQRFLDESSMHDAPASTSDGLSRRVLLETAPELTDSIMSVAAAHPDVVAAGEGHSSDPEAARWKAISILSARQAFSVKDRESTALRDLAGLYEADAFGSVVDAGVDSDIPLPVNPEEHASVAAPPVAAPEAAPRKVLIEEIDAMD